MSLSLNLITAAILLTISYRISRYYYYAFSPSMSILSSTKFESSDTQYFAGPKAEWLIGHARIIPREYAWKTFADWGKKFGDIVHIHVLGRSIIILNSLNSAKALFEKHSANNSDRPRFVYFQEIMGWGDMLVFMRYGEQFRIQRKMMQQFWSPQSIITARPTQRAQAHKLLIQLLHNPDNFDKHAEHFFSNSILMTAYGYEARSENDPFVGVVEHATRLVAESGNPGGTPVDIFPFLKHIPSWFPGAGFKRRGLDARIVIREMLDKPYEMVKRERANGTARPSFLRELMEDYEREGVVDKKYEENMKAVVGVLYGAAVETTASSLTTFILAMILYPSIAKKAQLEIDNAVGTNRLPDFDDRSDLVYLECILRETFRWQPPLPLGVPHSSMKEDTYRGKRIPAQSMIISNIWGIMRDPQIYIDADKFNPDRFLDKNKSNIETNGKLENSTSFEVFGFGRRICPGRYYADAGMWIAMACILACYDILPCIDEYGEEIIPKLEFTDGFTTKPKPFQCRFVLRDSKYEQLIRQTQY